MSANTDDAYEAALAKAREAAEAATAALKSRKATTTTETTTTTTTTDVKLSSPASSDGLKRKHSEVADGDERGETEANDRDSLSSSSSSASSSSKRRPGLGSDDQPRPNIGQMVQENRAGYVPTAAAAATAATGGMDAVQTVEIFVPGKSIGLIIGRGGDTVKRIEQENNVSITIEQSQAPERRITLVGTVAALQMAQSQINSLIMRSSDEPPPAVVVEAGNFGSEMIVIPKTKVGFIIGKGGETIRDLQARTGATITVTPDAQVNPMAPDRDVLIMGTEESRQRAKQFINDLIMNDPKQSMNAPKLNILPLTEGESKEEFMVPGEKVGLIIGRGGDTIRRLQAESGARAHFDPNTHGAPMRALEISGTQAQIEAAKQIVRDIIEERRNARTLSTPSAMPSTFETTGTPTAKFLHIPADKVGLVIGKGGETIKSFERLTGARVHLDQTSAVLGSERIISVSGNPQQVAYAEHLVSEKIGMMPRNPSNVQWQYAMTPAAPGGYGYYGMAGDPSAFMAAGYPPMAGFEYQMPPGMVMADPSQLAGQPGVDAQAAQYFYQAAGSDGGQFDPNAFASMYPGYTFNYQTGQWEPTAAGATSNGGDSSSETTQQQQQQQQQQQAESAQGDHHE